MELENKLENNINNELEKEQKNFFDIFYRFALKLLTVP